MAPRPNWKGYLKLSLVSCSVALYPATSESERVRFNQINSKTGSRIKYKKVDADTGDEVDSADIVKGYQVLKIPLETHAHYQLLTLGRVSNGGQIRHRLPRHALLIRCLSVSLDLFQ